VKIVKTNHAHRMQSTSPLMFGECLVTCHVRLAPTQMAEEEEKVVVVVAGTAAVAAAATVAVAGVAGVVAAAVARAAAGMLAGVVAAAAVLVAAVARAAAGALVVAVARAAAGALVSVGVATSPQVRFGFLFGFACFFLAPRHTRACMRMHDLEVPCACVASSIATFPAPVGVAASIECCRNKRCKRLQTFAL
jgi:hypothetical protein